MLRLAVAMLVIPLGLDLYVPVPDGHPLAREQVALGRRLFFETALSRDRRVACASCHDPARAFTDGHALAIGVFGRVGARSSPAIINRVYGESFFWDGRASSLEEQVLSSLQNRNEMDMRPSDLSARVKLPVGQITRALATYVRSILAGASRYDQFVDGERNALSAQETLGLQLFRGKANCTQCHNGPTFSDERFHNTGIAWRGGTGGTQTGQIADAGRFSVSGRQPDRGAFKTPTLREIVRTAPYMHDGSVATLEGVIDFYDRGANPNPWLDPALRPLALSRDERLALLSFLRALSGTITEGLRSLGRE